MDKGTWFWLLFVISLIFGLFCSWPENRVVGGWWRPLGGSLVVFILLGLLGLAVFGSPVR